MKKSSRYQSYEDDLKFTEEHLEEMVSFMAKCWNKSSNQHVYERVMDWALPCGWTFEEAILSYYQLYETYVDYFTELKKKYEHTIPTKKSRAI